MKHLIFFALLVISISSCTKEVQIDIPGYEEKIVIDGQIETDRPPIVLISTSKDIYAPTDLNAYLSGFISGATVTMNDGSTTYVLDEVCSDNLPPGTEAIAAQLFGIPESELANFHLCAYTSFDPAAFGQVGKTYSLNVSYDGKEYGGSTTIVPPTSLDSVFWKPENGLTNYGFSWATLTDPIGGYDAYIWEVKRINTGADGNPKDFAFMKTFNPVFDDEFIDGKTFDFFYENPMSFRDETLPDEVRGYYELGDSVVIKLSKMDFNVYQFLEKKYTQIATTGNPFASPTNLVTNLSGGCLGIWAGYSPSYDTLYCIE